MRELGSFRPPQADLRFASTWGRAEIGFVLRFRVVGWGKLGSSRVFGVGRQIGFVSHKCVPRDPRRAGINFGGIRILKFLARNVMWRFGHHWFVVPPV